MWCAGGGWGSRGRGGTLSWCGLSWWMCNVISRENRRRTYEGNMSSVCTMRCIRSPWKLSVKVQEVGTMLASQEFIWYRGRCQDEARGSTVSRAALFKQTVSKGMLLSGLNTETEASGKTQSVTNHLSILCRSLIYIYIYKFKENCKLFCGVQMAWCLAKGSISSNKVEK